jgi:PBP1b-binding outer membrane lipoprotein LpoB
MRHVLSIVLAIVLLSGCSASRLVRMAKKKDPSLFTVQIDTIRDTIFVSVPKVDTIFKYNFDTVEYFQDKVFIKYHYDTLTNEVFIEADCPDDSIIVETITKTEMVTLEPTFMQKIQWFLYAIGLGVLLILLIKLFK